MFKLKKLAFAGLAGAMLAIGAMAAPAQAGDRDGVCDTEELCLYWALQYSYSMSDIKYQNSGAMPAPHNDRDDASHYNDYFRSAGLGQGERLIDNALSGWNRRSGYIVKIYDQKSCQGNWIQIFPNQSKPSLEHINFRNKSHCWYAV